MALTTFRSATVCFGGGSGLTWHFQDTDPDFGQTQAKNLQLHFEQMLAVSAYLRR